METGCAGAEHMVLSFRLAKVECKGWGKSTRGLGINRGLMADIIGGVGRSHSSAFYSDFISVLKGRSLCHFFMCFSKVL